MRPTPLKHTPDLGFYIHLTIFWIHKNTWTYKTYHLSPLTSRILLSFVVIASAPDACDRRLTEDTGLKKNESNNTTNWNILVFGTEYETVNKEKRCQTLAGSR